MAYAMGNIDYTSELFAKGLTVLTYNTHLFGGSHADYANKARIVVAENFPMIRDIYPRYFSNIKEIVFDDDHRAKLIAERINDSGADIVALNEVWACKLQDEFMRKLAKAYPYSYHYKDHCKNFLLIAKLIEELLNKGDFQGIIDILKNTSGLLLLSKYPFKETPEFKPFETGRTKSWEDSLAKKGIITATIDPWKGGPTFRVGITHANTDVGGKDMPDLDDLAKLTVIGTDPAIMMGDFNVGCDAKEGAANEKYKKMSTLFKCFGAEDAYRYLKVNDPTVDWRANTLLKKFNDNPEPPKCLDYIFLRQTSDSGLNLKPVSVEVIMDWKYVMNTTQFMDLSDHYPVKVTFSVTRK